MVANLLSLPDQFPLLPHAPSFPMSLNPAIFNAHFPAFLHAR